MSYDGVLVIIVLGVVLVALYVYQNEIRECVLEWFPQLRGRNTNQTNDGMRAQDDTRDGKSDLSFGEETQNDILRDVMASVEGPAAFDSP